MSYRNKTLENKLRARQILLAAIASIFTLLIYLPSLSHSFVNWDDDSYILNNPRITVISLDFLKWAFTSSFLANWHPLTVITYALEYYLWGAKPLGYIIVNIILHSLNTLLVFFLTVRVLMAARRADNPATGADAPPGITKGGVGTRPLRVFNPYVAAFVASLLFGIHPLHVESVAWISETKDVLCAFFFLLSALFYLVYASGTFARKKTYYILSFVSFLLAVLAKPMAVTLPFVLLILDMYPCNRFSSGVSRLKEVRKALIEKIPFLLLSLLSGALTVMAQSDAEAISSKFSVVSRIGIAVRGYAFYLYKLVLPFDLAPVYPYPLTNADIFNFGFVIAIPALCVLFVLCVFTFKRRMGFSAAWIYYVVTLLPVIGIVQAGSQAAADRYMYLPSISLFVLAGVLVGRVIETGHRQIKMVVVIFAVLVISSFSVLTVWQEGIWQSSLTLWSHQILLYPGKVSLAYLNRSGYYFETGETEQSMRDVAKAIEISPNNAKAYNNRAVIFFHTGRPNEAFADMDKAIKLNPKYAGAYLHRGMMHAGLGELDLAVKDYTASIALDSYEPMAFFNRAAVYSKFADLKRAGDDYTAAINIAPAFSRAYFERAIIYMKTGESEKAMADLKSAVEFSPADPAGYEAIGEAYSKLGHADEARACFEKASGLRKRGYVATLNSDAKNAFTAAQAVIADTPGAGAVITCVQMTGAGYTASSGVTCASTLSPTAGSIVMTGVVGWGLTTNTATIAWDGVLTSAAP